MRILVSRAFLLLTVVCGAAVTAEAQPPIVPRHVLVDGSVGRPGREIVYLNLANTEQEPVTATVQILGTAGPSFLRNFTIGAETRRGLAMATEFPGLSAYYTVVVTFESEAYGTDVAAAVSMAWFRATDGQQVAESTAVLRTSTKR